MTAGRRQFLRTLAGGGALACIGPLAGCGNDVEPAPLANLSVGDDGIVRVLVPRYLDLVPIGGAITLDLQLSAQSLFAEARSILLVHRAGDSDAAPFVATQSRCPHAGCPLGYSPDDKLIECPCHGSRFRAVADPAIPSSCTGQVVNPPAPQPLTVYQTSYQPESRTVTIDLKRTLCTPTLPAPVGGTVTLPLIDYPSLRTPAGFVVGQPDGFADTLIVVRVDASTVIADSAVCTHMGCKVGWAAARDRFECPCHGSVYAPDGNVINGPATQPLQSYPAQLGADAVVVKVA
jgi:Rieske Fe-S protein